jgi:hypothetical protein
MSDASEHEGPVQFRIRLESADIAFVDERVELLRASRGGDKRKSDRANVIQAIVKEYRLAKYNDSKLIMKAIDRNSSQINRLTAFCEMMFEYINLMHEHQQLYVEAPSPEMEEVAAMGARERMDRFQALYEKVVSENNSYVQEILFNYQSKHEIPVAERMLDSEDGIETIQAEIDQMRDGAAE